jgi:hypothetical protein
VKYQISKLGQDKSEWENKNDRYKVFYRTDYNLVLKQSTNNDFFWITNFKTGTPLEDGIESISVYNARNTYNLFEKPK